MNPPVAGQGPEWRIATSTIVKLLVTAVLCIVVVRLAPLIVLLALSLLGACTLYPAICLLESRGMPHWAAALLVSAAVILAFVGVIVGVVPPLIDQFTVVAKHLPELQEKVTQYIPDPGGQRFLKSLITGSQVSSQHVVSAGQLVFDSVSEVVLLIALSLYLAADGKRTYAWLRAFFSPTNQAKLDETTQEASRIIFAYVLGQLVTSILAGVFVLIVLQLLHVPAALVLAVLAAVFDVLPMIGFFLFMVPAVLFGLTVSPSAAFTILVVYSGYHLLENYFIVPRVYGSRLRLTDLVVLTSVLAGAYLGGIAGAVLVLPLVAAYPTFERIWLVDYFGRRVVNKHQAIERAEI